MKPTLMIDCIEHFIALGNTKESSIEMVVGKTADGQTHFDYVVSTYGMKSVSRLCHILSKIDFTTYNN